MEDFTQSGEGAVIAEWAERRGEPGRFLSIGEADGIAASNVRALALRGWSGVCIEPAAILFDKLAHLYADRDDVKSVHALVGVQGDDWQPIMPFFYSRDLLSTTEPDHVETWKELVEFAPVYAAAVTVDELLAMFPGPYDMVSVDTEGTSLAIAKALLDMDALAPGGLLCVECEHGQDRWTAQQWCLDGWARVGITPNNLLLSRLC